MTEKFYDLENLIKFAEICFCEMQIIILFHRYVEEMNVKILFSIIWIFFEWLFHYLLS
jgi:hypothetical protein